MSYTNLLYHIIFSTRHRRPSILIENERRVYRLLFAILKKYGAETLRIGGMPDHIHLFISIPPTFAVSEFIQKLKRESSLAIKRDSILPKWDGWQDGYGAFTYSRNEADKIINYIKGQKEHHKRVSLIEEIEYWMKENGMETMTWRKN